MTEQSLHPDNISGQPALDLSSGESQQLNVKEDNLQSHSALNHSKSGDDNHSKPLNIKEQSLSELEQRVSILENAQLDADFVFKDFWAYAKATNEKIRSAKFLEVEDLAALRQRVDAACDRVKAFQDERNAAMDRISAIKRKFIEDKITKAKELIETDNNKSQNLLREILHFLKDEWGDKIKELNLDPMDQQVKMNKDDQEACWEFWRQVSDQCFVYYREIKQNNFIRLRNELYALADVVNNAEPLDAINAIKEFQKNLKGIALEKNDWEEIRTEINNLWERADQRFKAFKSLRNQQRIERRKKMSQRLEHWRIRQEANIQKFNDLISRNFDVITKIENHIEKLQRDLAGARSADFKLKIESWIKEQQEKVADIQKTNRELNQKIASIEKKIERVEAGEDPFADKPDNNAVSDNSIENKFENHIGEQADSESLINPAPDNHESHS